MRTLLVGVALAGALGAGAGLVAAQSTRWTGFRPGPELNGRVRAMAEAADGRVWFGVEGGLQVHDGYGLELFRPAPSSPLSFPTGPVESLLVDRRGRLWVGQRAGLVLIDPSGLARLDEAAGRFERFHHDPDDSTSLSNNRVRSIVQDRRGDLWVGTWSGLNRRPTGSGEFVRYGHDPDDPGSLAYDDVLALHVDARGSLWVGTIGGGLDRYDPNTDAFEHVPGVPSALLMTLDEGPDGSIWIGTLDGGMARWAPGAGGVRVVSSPIIDETRPRINASLVTRDDVLWVAASRSSGEDVGAVLRMDLHAPESVVWPARGRVRATHRDGDGAFWFGDGGDLVRWLPSEGSERRWRCPGVDGSDPLHWLSSILRTPDGALWVGYWDPRVGLCRLDPAAASGDAVVGAEASCLRPGASGSGDRSARPPCGR